MNDTRIDDVREDRGINQRIRTNLRTIDMYKPPNRQHWEYRSEFHVGKDPAPTYLVGSAFALLVIVKRVSMYYGDSEGAPHVVLNPRSAYPNKRFCAWILAQRRQTTGELQLRYHSRN